MRGLAHLREAKVAYIQQAALGATAEEICVDTDALSADADVRRGYGLPKVEVWHLLIT